MRNLIYILFFVIIGIFNLRVTATDSLQKKAAKAGKRNEAKASKWGFNPKNATKCLQSAIDSGVKRLIIDNTGNDWVIEPIKLRSNLELVFADGVVIKALKGAFKSPSDSLFNARNSKNITLLGVGKVVLKMHKEDYQDPKKYTRGEWRSVISLYACEDIKIQNLTLESSGGDGIYLGAGGTLNGCRNVIIDNIISKGNLRQGISVISAENLLIKDSKFINTNGASPEAGIDFEPNRPSEYLINNVVENCEFINNAGSGILIHLLPLTSKSKPVSITVRNCRSVNNKYGLTISPGTSTRGTIAFEKCSFADNKKDAFCLNNQREKGVELSFKDCVFNNLNSKEQAIIIDSSRISGDLGGLNFDNVTVMTGEKTPLKYYGKPGYGISAIEGNIIIKDRAGKTTNYNLSKFVSDNKPDLKLRIGLVQKINYKKLFPVSQTSKVAGNKIRFRGHSKFLQCTDKKGNIQLNFSTRQIRKIPIKIRVTVKDIEGNTVDKFYIKKTEYTYNLKVKNDKPTIYIFEINAGMNFISLASSQPGQSFVTPLGILGGRNHSFYFYVPADIKTIKVEVTTPPGEVVSARLLNPQGKIVDSFNKLDRTHQLRFERKDISKGEIWCIKFPYALDDFSFNLGSPLLPLVATAPEKLLIIPK